MVPKASHVLYLIIWTNFMNICVDYPCILEKTSGPQPPVVHEKVGATKNQHQNNQLHAHSEH